jgi:hypothetical protein
MWRAPQQLGRWKVELVGGESTASFARRLADANGIPVEEFWPMFGAPARKGGVPGEPHYGEGYLNAAALERLAIMAGRPVGVLQFVLPNLRPQRLLAKGGGPVWDWPWDTPGCFLVQVCEMCARTKGVALDAYLAADAPWQVCARHERWLDNRGSADAISLARLPEVVQAHRQRVQLERRLGAGGRALFADAYAITACWWNVPAFNSPLWQVRRRLLGSAGHDELRVASLVFYPEAVLLALLLAVRERRRLRRTLSPAVDAAWLADVTELLETRGLPPGPVLELVGTWTEQHPLLEPEHSGAARARARDGRPARGRHRRLPAADPHIGPSLEAVLGERSCLPWRLGELITTELRPAPRGWYLGGRA